MSRRERQWSQQLPRRIEKRVSAYRPDQLVVPVPGRPEELSTLLATEEVLLVEHGYLLNRTERPYDGTRGVQAYALFSRVGTVGVPPTTGWL